MSLRNVLLCALLGVGLMSPSSRAGLTFTLKERKTDHTDVTFDKLASGQSIRGHIAGSSVDLQFTSTQNLLALAGAQPRLGASSGGKQVGLQEVTISVPGGSYAGLIFNATAGAFESSKGQPLEVTVRTDRRVQTSYVGIGQNYLTIATTGGERILSTSLRYAGAGGFADIRNIRVSDAALAAPEPGLVTLVASGAGAFAVAGLRRLRRKPAA